jgi:DNA mismatch endonuclease (patch repair protein)
MADTFTPSMRSKCMSQIRSRGNRTTELRFAQFLREYGINGWRRGCNIFGKPDFVFRRHKLAIFIDGDFWHGNPRNYRLPKSNRQYWRKKIESNRARDRLVNRTLRQKGWTVLRFWESNLKRERAIAVRLKMVLGS